MSFIGLRGLYILFVMSCLLRLRLCSGRVPAVFWPCSPRVPLVFRPCSGVPLKADPLSVLGPAGKFTSGGNGGADLCVFMHIANFEFRVRVWQFV